MTATYNFLLVIISALIAILAAYTTLELAGVVTALQGAERKFWLTLGAISMGMGIWAMHFIAMLAFSIRVPISYNFVAVLISLLAAILASWQALLIVSRPDISIPMLLTGSTCMGIAIAAMHYIGMAAMQLQADINYDPNLFFLSVVIAIVVSLVALKLSFKFRNKTGLAAIWGKIISAIVMGAAVLTLHYTGMAAARFTENYNKVVAESGISNYFLAFLVSMITLLILGLTLFIVLASSKSNEPNNRRMT